MAIWAFVALFPAAAMGLIGALSALSWRRSILLFSVCLLWSVLGGVLVSSTGGLAFPGLLCFLEAAVGLAAWVGVMLRRLRLATAPAPSTSDPPAPSPPATS